MLESLHVASVRPRTELRYGIQRVLQFSGMGHSGVPARSGERERGGVCAKVASRLAELRRLFDTLDKDGDGNVTGQEWGKKVPHR